jgi:hypothetical protein
MNNQVDWNTIEKKSLPLEYQNYSIEELKTIVEKMIILRKKIESEIKNLNAQRDAFVLDKKKSMSDNQENTLEKALTNGIKKQIEDKGCQFPNS